MIIYPVGSARVSVLHAACAELSYQFGSVGRFAVCAECMLCWQPAAGFAGCGGSLLLRAVLCGVAARRSRARQALLAACRSTLLSLTGLQCYRYRV